METLPEISLGTAALIIFGCCAVYMLIRGIARTFVNTLFLVISAWVGFRVWQEAPSLALDWTGKTSSLITTGLPVLAFLATLVILRKIIGFFRKPIAPMAEEVAPRSKGQLLFRLVATVVPAALICLTGATFIHHVSSIAEIRDSAEKVTSSTPASSLAERLKNAMSVAIPADLMDKLDPLTTAPRLKLAKMIAAGSEKPLEPVINPETGRPYPRAIIVDDPELVELAREGRFSTLLRHPRLTEALEDPGVRKLLGVE